MVEHAPSVRQGPVLKIGERRQADRQASRLEGKKEREGEGKEGRREGGKEAGRQIACGPGKTL